MDKAFTVLYECKSGLYANLTNRCPCKCSFCIREKDSGAYGSPSLWLEREPGIDDVLSRIRAADLSKYGEFVFCGYGEPTERLDLLLETASLVRSLRADLPIRLNTNGLSDLINGRKTAPLFSGLVDVFSISLNSATKEGYMRLCNPVFGTVAYGSILAFAEEVSKIGKVVLTAVKTDDLKTEEEKSMREIASRLNARFRLRDLD